MNLYGNYSFLDLGFNDPTFIESLSLSRTSSIDDDDELQPARISSLLDKASKSLRSPPKHRHDGTSPLPLGMDWSPPPRVWDGHDTIWPHDSHTGWSYCATIPSWTILSRPRGSATVVLYRVQIGIQSPDGFTTTREILRRFSDFLKLSSELKKEFPKKKLPPAPSKGLLRMQSNALLEERRCLLEDWMTKVLSDIELSRSARIGIFLELEAAARSSFYELNQNAADVNSSISVVPLIQFSNSSDVSLLAGQSSFASDCGNDSAYGTPELGSPTEGMSRFCELDNAAFYQGFTPSVEAISEVARLKHGDSKPAKDSEQGNQENRLKMPYTEDNGDVSAKRIIDNAQVACKDEMELFSGRENLTAFGHDKQTLETDISSERISDLSNFLKLEALRNTSYDSAEGAELLEGLNAPASSDLQFPGRLKVVIQLEEQTKMNRILSAMQLRLATAKTDMEDLLMRLNQEHAVRQYLATKVKDLEIELESLKQSGKENLQQAIQMERENFTHMLWDMEELRRKCVEMELNLTSEQAYKVQMESTQRITIQENERMYEELNAAQQQINSLRKHHLESESKSKADVKLLIKEIKSLRTSLTEQKQELCKLAKEKAEVERILKEERQIRERANAANIKLLHECEIVRNRLEECSVSFLIEEENKLVLEASSPSDAIDILSTSDNRIGLLLAEAQLLAEDVETTIASRNLDGGYSRTAVDELRKQLADVYVDNAKLRKQMNSVIRYALQTSNRLEENEEESLPTKTALTKFLEG
ncbi:PX domain-containing protein EREL2 isoform X2 [Nicotiana tabacum]|uniref:Leucine-rich repeat-containing protein DDB_G0290503 isoform X2 n=1 Tax=Nicotiana tabacum TaxID=4097 RepID=A0A1S4AKR7_TOBAC|nr:PREDICTED: putative leucine-rich repeat-containing protein DDB_G0290503 isoform X2 [Nicotiana tabacum]